MGNMTFIFVPQVCFSDEFMTSMARIKNVEARKQVVSHLGRLSGGWRLNQEKRAPNMNGALSQVLKLHAVDGSLNLAWSVNIMRENSEHIQVLKVWDVLPLSEIPKLSKRLATEFGNYTPTTLNQCTSRRVEG